MELIIFLISIIITFFCPMLSIFTNLANYILFKKERKIYAILTALSLALIAYTWKPELTYDLYGWQEQMKIFSYSNLSVILSKIATDLEPLNYIIKYIISKSGNFNLLQFSISFIGYYEILWMIADYSKENKIKVSSIGITTIYILLSLKYIDFISGLWFNFAIINFALGIYLEYIKKSKKIHWLFYLISVCTHISTLYVLILLLVTKFIKIKNPKKVILIVFFASLFFGPIITFLNQNLNIYIVNYIYNLYNSYFIKGDRFNALHSGINLIYAIIKILICIIIIYLEKIKIKKYDKKYITMILITSVSIIAILFHAKVYIRFAFFIQLISIPIILDFFSGNLSKKKMLVILLIAPTCILFTKSQYTQMKKSNLFKCINYNITKPIYKLENGYNE